ncbi:Acg family FMN-binding oxidoreductase [Amycolatopsis sacchari]|uniref:Acg family FMN-binding oxidoreductase n=1 Tax=Amycolatopsis sacchari TaxID=115433 RepID=UPI003EBF6C28
MTWSATEVSVLARAVSRAPSVHNSQPWTVEVRPDGADLFERTEARLPRHDPAGRDQMISCGAALADLELAVRTLGWDPRVTLFPDAARPDLVARVVADGRREATEDEVARYSAIFRRRSYRAPFSLHPVTDAVLRDLVRANDTPGTELRAVDTRLESPVLAELFGQAGQVLRDDRAYQRELQAWSDQFRHPLPAEPTLPWGGLVRATTHLPDTITLTERLAAERLLIVLTPGDTRTDHLLAGRALQLVWLTAVTRGLAGSVLTQPLRLPEVRAGLTERLLLPGHPQLVLRLGYPVTATPVSRPAPALSERSGGDH